MLVVLRRPDLDKDEPLRPTIRSYTEKFQWFDHIPCWLRLRRHFFGSGIWYSGTAGRKGFGWQLCSNCGRKKKRVRVLP